MRAVGIHVFAGGFTKGVKRVCDVECQLETHGFGLDTAELAIGVPTVNEPAARWPDVKAELAFGNPRCTGFSCVTAGLGDNAHGAWSAPTIDVHQLCEYSAGRFDVIVWESVQQAFTVGRELLDYLVKEIFAPKGYRVCHLMINAASFGNVQNRKRYFFVAYRDDRNFNVQPPSISPWYPVAYDVLWPRRHREVRTVPVNSTEYDGDCWLGLTEDEHMCIPYLPNGWSANTMGKYAPHLLTDKLRKVWENRASDMPFSMHAIHRANYLRPFPTLTSSALRVIHPEHHRPCTIGELAAIMGWEDTIPVGKNPVAQLAKGVVPQVGEWLAEQAQLYLDNHWGDEDWESKYDHHTGEWVGRNCDRKQVEKTIDMTRYVGTSFDRDRYEVSDEILFQHRLHVDGRVRARIA